MSKLVMIVAELGCAYRWSKKWKQLEWCPMYVNGILDEDEWGTVDEDVVGEELVVYQGKQVPLSAVYRDVELKLGSIMKQDRIDYLRGQLDSETISTSELLEIEEVFEKIPDENLRDLRANAMARDMLEELEDFNEN